MQIQTAVLPPGELANLLVLVRHTETPVVRVEKPKPTLWKDFEPRFGWLHHFLMIIPEHIRARSPLYNPVGGPVAATHKQPRTPSTAPAERHTAAERASLPLCAVNLWSWNCELNDSFHTRRDESPRLGSAIF